MTVELFLVVAINYIIMFSVLSYFCVPTPGNHTPVSNEDEVMRGPFQLDPRSEYLNLESFPALRQEWPTGRKMPFRITSI